MDNDPISKNDVLGDVTETTENSPKHKKPSGHTITLGGSGINTNDKY